MTAIPASIDLNLRQDGSLPGSVAITGWKPDQADLYVFRYPGNQLAQNYARDFTYLEEGEASGWVRVPPWRTLGTGATRALFKIAPLSASLNAACPADAGIRWDGRADTVPAICQRFVQADVVALAEAPPLRRLAFVWAWEPRAFAKDAVRRLMQQGVAVKVITVGSGYGYWTPRGAVRLGSLGVAGGVLSGEEFLALPTAPEPINWWMIGAITAATVGMVWLVTRK